MLRGDSEEWNVEDSLYLVNSVILMKLSKQKLSPSTKNLFVVSSEPFNYQHQEVLRVFGGVLHHHTVTNTSRVKRPGPGYPEHREIGDK